MDNEYWGIDDFCQGDGSVGCFRLYDRRSRTTMMPWLNHPPGNKAVCKPFNDVGVLGVDHSRYAMTSRTAEYIENLLVIEFECGVRHVDLQPTSADCPLSSESNQLPE